MGYPTVELREEVMREGMQIESVDITPQQKADLLTELAKTGIASINVGSFVSPKYTPQMANIEETLRLFTPIPGPTYTCLAFNQRGLDRAAEFEWLKTPGAAHGLVIHLCDTFARRNMNRSQLEEKASWASAIARAQSMGATEATITVGAAWGSNFQGAFSTDQRMALLRMEYEAWAEAGIAVTAIGFADPMGWCSPAAVAETLAAVRAEWPGVKRIHQHLHNTRGLALASVYASIAALDETYTISFDVTAGGIGGCPYCGNGRLTGMAATEDVVNMLRMMGIDTGIDLEALIEFVQHLDEVIGYRSPGHVSHAGPAPLHDVDFYDPNLPLVETVDEAQHFRLGPSVAEHQLRPWAEPIPPVSPLDVEAVAAAPSSTS